MTTAIFPRPINWVNTLFFAGLHLGALLALLPGMTNWSAVGIALFLYWVTGGLGITLGFHRLVTHRSFQTSKWLEYFFVFCGTLACQGGPIEWVGTHRIHHLYSDQNGDPHDSNQGFWWSHIGWLIFKGLDEAEIYRFSKDIAEDPVYQFLDKNMIWLQIALGVVLLFLGGWSWVIWGVFVRIVWVYHCTWLVNSATHKFGYRSHESGDNSTNCWWVALLVFGEGWHNNHHAFQYSARHGLKWWEVDLTWMTIWLLKSVGLASNVKLAGDQAQ
jgi:stearoyl-CoA desaturase (delta-9 desaturase)